MAFSVIYKNELRPYEDWCQRGKPQDTIIKYKDHTFDDVIMYLYVPDKNLMFIDMEFDNYVSKSILRIKPIEKLKKIQIIALSCHATDYWPMVNHNESYETGSGSFRFFRTILKAVPFNILKDISRYFFGPDWSFKKLPTKMNHVFDDLQCEMRSIARQNSRNGLWDTTMAFYDYTRINAAIKIQASYRGWITRLRYRYNPHTCLGKYLLQKEFYKI